METEKKVDVQGFIDQSRIAFPQLRLIALCIAIMLIEGYDTTVVGYIAPALRSYWNLQPQALAPLFGIGLLGLGIGSLALGPIADRVGRKTLLIGSVGVFGLASLASAFAPDLSSLVILRFLTGLGLGSAMPNAYTLAAEYSPARLRASLVAPIGCGMAAGGALGGLFAGTVMQTHSWSMMFIIGGLLPLVLLPVLVIWLPESARYLIARGAPEQKIRKTLQRMYPAADLDEIRFVHSGERRSDFPVKHLFSRALVRDTLLLWMMTFGTLLVVYMLGNWLPLLVHESGAAPGTGARMMSCYLFGSTVGAILLGVLMDKYKPQRVICITMIAASVALASLGGVLQTTVLAFTFLFIIGMGTGGTMTGANILATIIYPTHARATGVGWALAFGRIGSVVGATVVGAMLTAGWSLSKIFLVAAGTLFFAALCAALLRNAPPSRLQRRSVDSTQASAAVADTSPS